MSKLNDIKKEYDKVLNFNKNLSFSHSINIDRYKIYYKEFYSIKSNKNLSVDLAEQSIDISNEALKKYLIWLSME